ncbi:hypothetical protein F5H01DRAFT_335426 [Linnemannia elongata]|nr:hypothetical protein F5H01DRAFT_335426 [Linnemannia elongata]
MEVSTRDIVVGLKELIIQFRCGGVETHPDNVRLLFQCWRSPRMPLNDSYASWSCFSSIQTHFGYDVIIHEFFEFCILHESLLLKSCITLFIYPPTYSFLITYSFIYSSHHQAQCNQEKTITIKKGVRLLSTQKANVTQQLIQVHSVRKVTDSLGISVATPTRIRKENKVNIPPPKIGRPIRISLRTKEVLARQFKTGQMTKLKDSQRFIQTDGV